MSRAIVLCCLLAGCFDSLVSDPCAAGFALQAGQCVARAAPDAGMGSDTGNGNGSDAAVPDALVCALPELDCDGTCIDVTSDPNNCGACGRVCPSGVCVASACVGTVPGHIVAIGHDYQLHDGAMVRVLANAVALGQAHDVGVVQWTGTATGNSANGTAASIGNGMAQLGRPWHTIAMPPQPSANALAEVDTLVIDAQIGDGNAAEAAGASWEVAIDPFLARGGVVIVLEGRGGVSYRFAKGAALYTVGAPGDATAQSAVVVDGADAIVQQVVSPYLAMTTSTTQPGATHAVIATTTGAAIVSHLTR